MSPMKDVTGETKVEDVTGNKACVQDGVYYKDDYSVKVIALISAVPNNWGVYYTFLGKTGNRCGVFVPNDLLEKDSYRPSSSLKSLPR